MNEWNINDISERNESKYKILRKYPQIQNNGECKSYTESFFPPLTVFTHNKHNISAQKIDFEPLEHTNVK